MLFGTVEVDHPHGVFLFKEQIEGGVVRIFSTQLAQLDEVQTDSILIFCRFHAGDKNLVQTGKIDKVIPARNALLNIVNHFGAQFGRGETLK